MGRIVSDLLEYVLYDLVRGADEHAFNLKLAILGARRSRERCGANLSQLVFRFMAGIGTAPLEQ